MVLLSVTIVQATWIVIGLVPAGAATMQSEDSRLRMILARNVACRAKPAQAAPAVRSYQLGDRLLTSHVPANADPWYFSEWDRCWVAGHLITRYAP